mgnify:CR=1 FL=1
MNWRNKLIIFLLLLGATAHGQIGNLVGLDEKLVHFGIQVGYTQSKFDLHFADDPELRELLQGTTSYYNAGFHIAVIGDLKAGKYINLRLCPGVTLLSRSLDFAWEQQYHQGHPRIDTRRGVESVYGELPFDLKFRAARWHNMRPYLTAGASYGFDFASLRNNKNNTDESIIRLNTSDFRYTAGVGFDFYLRYVKFAIELKMAFGLTDLKIEDDNLVTRSYDNLNSRTFMLGFTFEG